MYACAEEGRNEKREEGGGRREGGGRKERREGGRRGGREEGEEGGEKVEEKHTMTWGNPSSELQGTKEKKELYLTEELRYMIEKA